jgi:hypothetical protein
MQLDSGGKLVRAQALMGVISRPRIARVEFTGLKLPGGRVLPIHTVSAAGLPTLYIEPKPPKQAKQAKTPAPTAAQNQTPSSNEHKGGSALGTLARQEAKKQINSRSIPDQWLGQPGARPE